MPSPPYERGLKSLVQYYKLREKKKKEKEKKKTYMATKIQVSIPPRKSEKKKEHREHIFLKNRQLREHYFALDFLFFLKIKNSSK